MVYSGAIAGTAKPDGGCAMMVRLTILGGFLTVTLGAWAMIRPPSPAVYRLADGALVSVASTEVTRSSPLDPVFPSPDQMLQEARFLDDTIDGVLDTLGFAEDGPSDAGLPQVTTTSTLTGYLPDVDSADAAALAALLSQGLQAQQDDAAIHAALSAAVAEGTVQVPAALMTTDGTIDTELLLQTVVTRAKQRIGAEDAPGAIVDVTNYTVAEGDSIARVAALVYGDPTAFPALMEANDTVLSHPTEVTVGMRLLVPPL